MQSLEIQIVLSSFMIMRPTPCNSCGSLMALLHWQLGREVGAVKRLLEEEGINWGYFIDHNPFEPHCNAHPNNFVVLPPVRLTLTGWNRVPVLTVSLSHTHRVGLNY